MQEQGDYTTETQEALDMLGKGYEDQPSVVVEPPRRRIERRGKQMMEVEDAAFVKFSTEFKAELADLDVYALKVFIYIGLSINFETGTAYPGVRKIAAGTNMDKDTVTKAIEELEEKGFLHVWRRDGTSNVYKPNLYFAIGDTVPHGRTVEKLSGDEPKLSHEKGKLSPENAKLSPVGRVKDAQQEEQDLKQDGQKIKDFCLSKLQEIGYSVFGNDKTIWNNFRRRLERDDISIVGDEKKIVISGLGEKPKGGQFTQAEIWQERIAPYYEKFGVELEFQP